jgi:hypothetical protein
MIYVFPRMTKCTFHKFGTSGNIEKHDALCILPLNIVNEKIYIFIWFWLLLLGLLTFLILVSDNPHTHTPPSSRLGADFSYFFPVTMFTPKIC